MAHTHDHSHSNENVSDGVLLWSVIINIGLLVFEFIAGLVSGSMALMADALHNTNDAGALLIAYVARKISHRGADENFTFGYRRAELIGAMIQLTALIIVGLFLVYEAIQRFFMPEPLKGGWIMAAAGVALVVDIVTAWLLWAMSRGSVNVKAAFLHNLTDAGASFAVLIGGAAIYWINWTWIDPALTLMIAGYILYMSFGLLRKTASILMEGTPPDLSLDDVVAAIQEIEGVVSVHHLHVWELDENHRALEAHVRTGIPLERPELRMHIKKLLQKQFHIDHCTLELEAQTDDNVSTAEKLIPPH